MAAAAVAATCTMVVKVVVLHAEEEEVREAPSVKWGNASLSACAPTR